MLIRFGLIGAAIIIAITFTVLAMTSTSASLTALNLARSDGVSGISNPFNPAFFGPNDDVEVAITTDGGGQIPGAGNDVISVTVLNVTTGVDVEVNVVEDGATADLFEGDILFSLTDDQANENLAADPPVIFAEDGDVFRVIVQALVRQFTVDAEGPIISGLTPQNGAITRFTSIAFQGTFTDTGSGIIDTGGTPDGLKLKVDGVDRSVFATFSDVDDGFEFSLLQFLSEGIHTFQVTAIDAAGNQTISDADLDIAGSQPHSFEIDLIAPELREAFTGQAWNAETGTIINNARDWVRVAFTRSLGSAPDKLKASSLHPTDFLLDNPTPPPGGVSPIAVVFPNLAPDAPDNNSGLDLRSIVFLQLASDLDSDATPDVVVLPGSFEDVAGNPIASAAVAANDRIAPEVAVDITGTAASRPVSNGQLRVRVVIDEDGLTPANLDLELRRVEDHIGPANLHQLGGINLTATGAFDDLDEISNDRVWEWTFYVSVSPDGLYNVFVQVSDIKGNVGTAGDRGDDNGLIDVDSAGLILLEIDNEINGAEAPVFTLIPNSGTPDETNISNPTVRIDFDAESGEYSFGDELDSHPGVTLISVLLDDSDVIGNVNSVDQNSFNVHMSGLSEGSHTLQINAQDDAGNSYPIPQNFTFDVSQLAHSDLSLTKAGSPDPVLVGESLTYTLTAMNNGPDNATGVTITDHLPESVEFLLSSAGCVYDSASHTVTCSVGELANGADASSIIVVKPTEAGTITNSAGVAANEVDIDETNNAATTTTLVGGMCGDPNNDGVVNVLDAILELQFIVGKVEPNTQQLILGDVVRNGAIDVFDVIFTLQHIVGKAEITECGPPLSPTVIVISNGEGEVGDTVAIEIAIHNAITGVAGFGFIATVDGQFAEIVNVILPEYGTLDIGGDFPTLVQFLSLTEISALPAPSVSIKVIDLNNVIKSTFQPQTLATLCVSLLAEVSASNVAVSLYVMDDDDGVNLIFDALASLEPGTLEIFVAGSGNTVNDNACDQTEESGGFPFG